MGGLLLRCSENGEELLGDSDQLCGAHMEGKHGSTGHGESNSPVRIPSGAQVKELWHGTAAVDSLLPKVSWPPATHGCSQFLGHQRCMGVFGNRYLSQHHSLRSAK